MRHLEPEILTQLIEKTLDTEEMTLARAHLNACGQCTTVLAEFRELLGILVADSSNEPPPELVKWGIQLFQPAFRVVDGSASKVLRIAKRVFDSFEQPAPRGVRSVGSLPRQLLFRAGDVDVDVRIEPSSEDHVALSGQVLSASEGFFEDAPVRLETGGQTRYQTQTNPVGEFSFDEVSRDTYHLTMDLPDGQVRLLWVHRRE